MPKTGKQKKAGQKARENNSDYSWKRPKEGQGKVNVSTNNSKRRENRNLCLVLPGGYRPAKQETSGYAMRATE